MTLRVHVLDSRDVGAFAWPQGDIVVTAALVELLDDDELAAALAHEVGHLLEGGHLRSAMRLVGKPAHDETEAAADELGIQLLAQDGRPASAMARMIRKVQAARGSNDSAFKALGHRLELLERKQ
jgi:Zn-dependent protease with chaperone function